MLRAALSAVTMRFDVNKWGCKERCSRDRTHFTYTSTSTKKSALCVAVAGRNILMVKLLLIHGALPSHCVQIMEKTVDIRNQEQSLSEQSTILSAFDIIEKPIDDNEDVQRKKERPSKRRKNKRSRNEAELKREITTLLKSGVRWFPELIEFYPRQMRQSVSVIFETLSDERFPQEIIIFVIEYFNCEP